MNERSARWRVRLSALASLMILLSPCRGADDALSRRSLKGLPGVSVKVGDLEHTTVENCRPLDAIQLRTDVELKLRKAGVAILSGDDFATALATPQMSINVVCSASDKEAMGYVELTVAQEVVLARDQTAHLYLVTWSASGGLGQQKREGLERVIRDKLQDQIDKFLNAYMAANAPRR